MSSFLIPDGLTLDGITPRQWWARLEGMAALTIGFDWMLGEYLLAAPDEDALADFLKFDPRICSRRTAEAEVTAARFPPSARSLVLPWSYHEAVTAIDDAEIAAEILDQAEAEAASLQAIERTVAQLARPSSTEDRSADAALFEVDR